jgi:hypothetical protein
MVIGTPVLACARATARSTRSTPSVRPLASTAHLSMPARTPVSAMPSVMSRMKKSVIVSSGRREKNSGTSSKV